MSLYRITGKMTRTKIVVVVFTMFAVVDFIKNKVLSLDESSFHCNGVTYLNVSTTAYFPDYEDLDNERGYVDMKGKKLRTLQDYLDGRVRYVTLGMDSDLQIPYGTPVCSPELNHHFGQRIKFQVRDVGTNMKGSGYQRADICVRTEVDTYDRSVNRQITLVF